MEQSIDALNGNSAPKNSMHGMLIHFPRVGVSQFFVARVAQKSVPGSYGRFANRANFGVQAIAEVLNPSSEHLFHGTKFE